MTTLAAFLTDPNRPPDTLSYHELQGFLFAVASAPELVRPSEWLPMVFGGESPEYRTEVEAQTILGELMAVYNAINATVAGEHASLPDDCRFLSPTLANLETAAPISQWCRGFARGHSWLEDDWEPYLPEDNDDDFGLMLLALTFFGSRELAVSYLNDPEPEELESTANEIRRAFPAVVADYAQLGRSISQVLMQEQGSPVPRTTARVGRNAPCPCGSGRKYKKCCGAGPAV